MTRLVRILLAFAIAFVVTARTEAAAEHCRKLIAAAETAMQAPEAETAPCHDAHETAAPETIHHPGQTSPEPCECLAVLIGYVALVATAFPARIEPYAWAPPQEVALASTAPAPAWRPPRA